MNGKNLVAGSAVKGIGIGALVSVLVTLFLSSVAAFLIGAEKIPVSVMDYSVMVIIFASAVTGSTVGTGKASRKRLYISLLIAASYLVLLLSVTAAFFEGQYHGVGVTALVIGSGSIIAVLIGKNGGNKPQKRRSKMKHR